ncbi:MAG: metallophosphoesterase [Thermodesulfobacteriota bacterium]
MGRRLVIGDIHGCRDTLAQLLAQLGPPAAGDTFVFLGDYLDRGPDPRGVVDTILALRRKFQVIALMGNHERMLLDYLAGSPPGGMSLYDYFGLGGLATLESYGVANPFARERPKLPASHQAFLQDLLPYWEDDQHIYVHAGLRPGLPLHRQPASVRLWIRDEFLDSRHDFGKRVVFGHTPFPEPLVQANKIGLDTGAVYGGHLTCLVLPEMTFVQVKGPAPAPDASLVGLIL